MKRLGSAFLSTLFIFFFTLYPVTNTYAQEDAFEPYEDIFKGGLQGLSHCGSETAKGIMRAIAPELAAATLSVISSLIRGVPVETPKLQRIQEKATDALNDANIKETCLDSFASAIAHNMLEQMINDSVEWLNTMDNGAPGWVENLNTELQRVAVRSYRDYIRRSDILSSTCSLYLDEVLIALDEEFDDEFGESGFFVDELDPLEPIEKVECQLDRITGSEENTRKMVEEGMWVSWEATNAYMFDPGSNPKLAFQESVADASGAVYRAQEIAETELTTDLFKPEKECPIGSIIDSTDSACINITTGVAVPAVTTNPRAATRNVFEQLVESDFYKVTLADELSDVYAVAGEKLIDRIFKGANGFLGIDPSAPNNPGKYEGRLKSLGDGSLFGSTGTGARGGGIFNGSDPVGSLKRNIEEQIEIEEDTLVELKGLQSKAESSETASLINTANQCPYFGTDTDAQTSLQTVGRIPGLAANGIYDDQGDEDVEIGPQKVDWAGNDFDWNEGERYGLSECNQSTVGGQDDRKRYKQDPQYSYYVARVPGSRGTSEFRWIISTCRVVDDGDEGAGSNIGWKRIAYQPLAFRDPIDPRKVEKVDWDGNTLDWKIIDRYENEENRYLYGFCDDTNKGEKSFHVGKFTRVVTDRAIEFKLEPGSQTKWYEATCKPVKYSNAGKGEGAFDYALDSWSTVREVGSAFKNLPQSTDSSIGDRIKEIEEIILELRKLQTSVVSGSITASSTDQIRSIQSSFNQLRSRYRFSDEDEPRNIRSLSSEFDRALRDVDDVVTDRCSTG